MADTTHLILPLLAAAQAQKHVTHNDALLRLDALVHLSVIDRDLTDPPGAPTDGDRYIPASGASGAWDAWDLNIAWYVDGIWTKLTPREGWRVWVEDEDVLLDFDGADWIEIEGGGGGAVSRGAEYIYDSNGDSIPGGFTPTDVTDWVPRAGITPVDLGDTALVDNETIVFGAETAGWWMIAASVQMPGSEDVDDLRLRAQHTRGANSNNLLFIRSSANTGQAAAFGCAILLAEEGDEIVFDLSHDGSSSAVPTGNTRFWLGRLGDAA